jgi:hypothetical protein
MAQIFNALSQVFSAAEHLTLEHTHSQLSEEHNTADRAEWRKLLRSFSNVKTLQVEDGFIEGHFRCLQLGEEELPLDLLPEMHEAFRETSRVTFYAAYHAPRRK